MSKRLFEIETPNDWDAVSAKWLRDYMISSVQLAPNLQDQVKVRECLVTVDGELIEAVDEKKINAKLEALDAAISDSLLFVEELGRMQKALRETMARQADARGWMDFPE